MQKAISKYGLAAHLALLAVAPLFLFPFCDDAWTARVVIWLSLFAAVWTILEPSRRAEETLHDARFRVASSIARDPLFWLSLCLVLIAADVVLICLHNSRLEKKQALQSSAK